MPAPSSSPIFTVLGQLAALPPAERDALVSRVPQLMAYLAWVPDPRDPRGVRHSLASLLAGAVAATLTGATSWAAISDWIAGVPDHVLATLTIRYDPLARRYEVPDESTIRSTLEALDAVAFSAATGSWLNDLATARSKAAQTIDRRPRRRPRRVLAVDGKALRGTRHHTATGRAMHLLAVTDTRTLAVLGQVEVDGKSNEITAFVPLLHSLDLTDTVITADAAHTQREHATFLVEGKNAHYILTAKKNQPSLYKQLKALPWRKVETGHSETVHGHGRTEKRSIKVCSVAIGSGLLFPHAAQAICITRKVRPRAGGRWKTVTVYAVTSLAPHQARPADLAAWIRAHWQIEALHHIRDVTYREDASQVRTGSGPAVMAALRNLAIGILKFCGWTNIAKANRRHAQDPGRCLATLGIT
ncbi:ISAs1 family transposase (plasmid) [Sphaerimonospora sp. CA-214678]|uniref:ISAs1 family transposase n=1 Tax=Sphaerimonospora sp. CA-214678 TaxID=3240029 RepID=UPI003D8F0D3A